MHQCKLSPSDFAYLYEECKRCYWMKVHDQVMRPQMPMPGIFSAINTRLQGTLVGKELRALSPSLPEGIVEKQEGICGVYRYTRHRAVSQRQI